MPPTRSPRGAPSRRDGATEILPEVANGTLAGRAVPAQRRGRAPKAATAAAAGAGGVGELELLERDGATARSTTGDLLTLIEELSSFDAIGVTRLARHLGIPVATAYRMLRILERTGYVEQFRDSKEYRLTLKIFEIGCRVASRTTMRDVAAAEIERLSEQSGLTANVGVLVDDHVLYLGKVETDQVLTLNLRPGSRVPATCTAMGKAMLAFDARPVRSIVGEGPYPARTARSVTRYEDLALELAEVQRRGFAVDREELSIGLFCVAAPIIGTRQAQNGAISVTSYGTALEEGEIERLGRLVMACAHRVSRRIGDLSEMHSWAGTARASYPRP